MIDHQRLHGLIAAPHTPFDATGAVALDVIEQQAAVLSAQGVAGVFVCGTTGEGVSMTNAERRAVVERWCTAAGDELKVIAHVGHTALEDACALARHAEKMGAWAVSSVAPFYFKPFTARDLVDYCAAVAGTVPQLPFYYYHSPGMTGVNVSPVAFLDEGRRIANLAGIKFNDGDLFEYQRCLAYQNGCFDLPFGVDEALIGGLAAGATSAVGSTYNYAAPIYLEMMEAIADGDLATAQACSRKAVAVVELLVKFGAVAAGKALMSLHGVECGAPRPPIRPLTAESRARLLEEAQCLGIGAIVPAVTV